MILKYKNFTITSDDYCWTLTQQVEYEKLEKLGGEKTGEIGLKDKLIGYYPKYDLSSVLVKMLDYCIPEDIVDLEKYISAYKEERLNLIKELDSKYEFSNITS